MKSDILSLLSHEIRILLVQYLSSKCPFCRFSRPPRKMLELFLPLAIISSKDCTFKISYLLLNDIRQFPVCTFPPEISKIKMNVSQTSSESRFFKKSICQCQIVKLDILFSFGFKSLSRRWVGV